jgi:hypothetical protein
MKKSPWRAFAAALIVAAGFCFVTGVYVLGLTDKNATERDFIQYWAAGQQLVHGANPYDLAAILRIEQAAGLEGGQPKITFSPPVAFCFFLPLGYVGAKTGLILWLLLLLAGLSVAIWMLWILQGRPQSRYHLLGYAFAPALSCLMAGQLDVFLLLGIVLFLRLRDSRPFLAGAVLLPCALKPHLFLPFAIVLLLWVASRRRYRLLGGFGAALLGSCAATLCFAPALWPQYAQMMRGTRVLDVFIPTLSVAFRFLVDRQAAWLQFLPEAAGCVWAVWYYWTRRARWNWMEHGMLLLIVSVACAPYAFFFDETILLPAVLAGLYRAANSGRSLLPLGLIAAVALIEVLAVVQVTSPFYLWTVPAWLAWYLYATGGRSEPAKEMRSGADCSILL